MSDELNIEAAVGSKLVYVYIEEKLENIEKTVCAVHYVGQTGLFKHFTFVLSPGKTRLTLTDLVDGSYEVHATQISKKGISVEGRCRFEFKEHVFDILDCLGEIADTLDEIKARQI